MELPFFLIYGGFTRDSCHQVASSLVTIHPGFLLTGGVSLEDPPARPAEWVPDRCWGELFRLAKSKEGLDGEGWLDVKCLVR